MILNNKIISNFRGQSLIINATIIVVVFGRNGGDHSPPTEYKGRAILID